MASQQADAVLVSEVVAGDQSAFGELVARYKDAVFGVAFHRLGDFEEARDVAQDAFVKAYLGLSKLRDGDAFAHWLYRIADGTAVDAARRRHGEVSLEDPDALDANHVLPSPTGDDALVARQVREALAQLAEPDRLAVVLHYVDGYSHAEVAQFLGTTPGAVKTRVSRAKAKLRKEMAEMVEAKLKKERPVVEYHARDLRRAVTSTSGTVDDMTEEQVRRLLTDQGFKITRLRVLSPDEIEKRRRLRERYRKYLFLRRIIRLALREGASALRLSLPGRGTWAGWFRVDHLVKGKWQLRSRQATSSGPGLAPREGNGLYLWDLARHQVAAAMGLDDVPANPRYRGEMGFRWKGREVRLRVIFSPKTVRLEVVSPGR
jgi:RNA polymerase sigma-70 factor (ECF subfamily)